MFKSNFDVPTFQIIAAIFGTALCVLGGMYLLAGHLYPVELPLMIAFGGAGWIVAAFLPILLLRKLAPVPDDGAKKMARVLPFPSTVKTK